MPSFFKANPHVGALIIKVANTHPEVFNKLTSLNFFFRVESAHKINEKHRPMAPLSPPYVKAPTYLHLRPYPDDCNFGIKRAIEKNLAAVKQP